MQLSDEEWLQVEREWCGRSLANFTKEAWSILEPSTELKWGWALDAMCEHLEAVARGEILRLLMNVPPGTMKSMLTSVIYPAWEWGPLGAAHKRYLSTAHKADLAIRDNMKCRRLIQSQWYQDRWPITLTGDQNAKTKFENDKFGFRESMAFTSMTGSRGDTVILDDPHSVNDANSNAHLTAGVRTFKEALPSRVNNDKSSIIIIMQRLNEADVSAAALELGYEHLCIPMRYEPNRAKTTVIGWKDPRTEAGELMFPERFPEKQVVELEKSLGSYAVAGQLQQRPAPAGGGIFKTNWWQFYTVLPVIRYRIIFGDTAQKTAEQNDFSVFQCWGMGVDGRIYLLDMVRGKWEAPELLLNARAFWEKHRGRTGGLGVLRKMMVEDKSSGTGLIQQLRPGIPVEGIPRSTDKVSRAMDVTPQIEVGNVVLPDPSIAPWLADLLTEAEQFPNAAHDDTIDPLMDAVQTMLIDKATINYGNLL